VQDEEWDDEDDLDGADKGEFDYLSCKLHKHGYDSAYTQLG